MKLPSYLVPLWAKWEAEPSALKIPFRMVRSQPLNCRGC